MKILRMLKYKNIIMYLFGNDETIAMTFLTKYMINIINHIYKSIYLKN